MESEKLKVELSKIAWKNLRVNDGNDAETFGKIAQAFGTDASSVLAFAAVNSDGSGERGIIITQDGIKWKDIADDDMDSEDFKETWESGAVTFKNLATYKSTASRTEKHFCVRLANRDLRNEENLYIDLAFRYDAAEAESEISEQFKAFESLFALLVSVEPQTEKIPDECDGELADAFIGGTKDSIVFYREAFAYYSEKGGNFAFRISGAGFLFGAINLIHRKLYLAAVLWLLFCGVLAAVFGSSSGILQIVVSIIAAFLNPYLVYRKFRKILLDCHNHNMTREQTIENLKLRGGPNQLTNAIYDSPIFTVLKVIFFIFVALEAISWIVSLFR